MKTSVLFLASIILAAAQSLAQNNKALVPAITTGKNNAASIGINIPVGTFSQTHVAGIALGYTWSHHRFGNLQESPGKLIGFTCNGGIAYYLGTRTFITGYDYRYSGYVSLHAFGGAVLNPAGGGYIALTTGATAGIYKGTVDPGFGASFGGGYPVSGRISLTGSIICLNHKDASGFWAVNIGVEYSF